MAFLQRNIKAEMIGINLMSEQYDRDTPLNSSE